jgi:hypothetical protein
MSAKERGQAKISRDLTKCPIIVFKLINANKLGTSIQDPLDIPPVGMFAPIPGETHNDEATLASEDGDHNKVRTRELCKCANMVRREAT